MIDATDDRQSDDAVGRADEAESSTRRALLRTAVARSLSNDGFGSVQVISPEMSSRVLTEKRREIIDVLDSTEISSQRDLARKLDRDPGAVQRDLTELIEAGIVEIHEEGRSKRPTLTHDTVVVEPLVAPDSALEDAEYTVQNEP